MARSFCTWRLGSLVMMFTLAAWAIGAEEEIPVPVAEVAAVEPAPAEAADPAAKPSPLGTISQLIQDRT